MSKDRRLGRGLAALLGTPIDDEFGASHGPASSHAPSEIATDSNDLHRPPATPSDASLKAINESLSAKPAEGGPLLLPVDQIDNNPFQPRREFNEAELDSLAESIKEHQQLQPILVRRVGDRYQIISGERRYRATVRAGLTHVRAELRDADDRLVAELAIIENLQRKDLNAIEKALSFKRYIHEHRCTQEDLAKRLKIDRSTIANLMRLLELPQPVLDAIQKDQLSAGHARALLPLGEESKQIEIATVIQAEGWSVRDTERRVSELLASEDDGSRDSDRDPGRPPAKRSKSEHIASLERELKLALGTAVEIRQGVAGRGKLIISFSDANEFERLREVLTSSSGTRFRLAS